MNEGTQNDNLKEGLLESGWEIKDVGSFLEWLEGAMYQISKNDSVSENSFKETTTTTKNQTNYSKKRKIENNEPNEPNKDFKMKEIGNFNEKIVSSEERLKALEAERSQKSPSKSNDNDKSNEKNKNERKETKNEQILKSNQKNSVLISQQLSNQNSNKQNQQNQQNESSIRCIFYPECTKTDCPFLHPTEPCKNFPNCRFGQECHYIHPICKFGSACNKGLNCPFNHPLSLKKSQFPTPTPCLNGFSCKKPRCTYSHPLEACIFGEQCRDISNCKYGHQPHCRNGVECNIPGCKFSHITIIDSINNDQISSISSSLPLSPGKE